MSPGVPGRLTSIAVDDRSVTRWDMQLGLDLHLQQQATHRPSKKKGAQPAWLKNFCLDPCGPARPVAPPYELVARATHSNPAFV